MKQDLSLDPTPTPHSFQCTRSHVPSFTHFICIYGNHPNHSFLCPHPASSARLFPTGLCFQLLPLQPSLPHPHQSLGFCLQGVTFRIFQGPSCSPALRLLGQGLPPPAYPVLEGAYIVRKEDR